MDKMFSKKAFTLAEVLISLTVIGVIAAITVPALIQKTQKQEYVSALKKTYSTLSQVTNQIIAEHGSPKAEGSDPGWGTGAEAVYNLYKKYLNNAKDCKDVKNCFGYNSAFKDLNGHNDWQPYRLETNGGFRLVLADGTILVIEGYSKNCNINWHGNGVPMCSRLSADVNGIKKPNTFGRDIFVFELKKDGLYPAYCGGEIVDCNENSQGFGCACRVLREGAMNY